MLDGIAAKEGRIVLMTSNFAESLDDALVRPGRIDKIIFLGYISPESAGLMFKRMYQGDPAPTSTAEKPPKVVSDEELEELAQEFGSKITKDIFTPAKLGGYLLAYRNDPRDALEGIDEWVAGVVANWEEVERRAKEAALARKKMRR